MITPAAARERGHRSLLTLVVGLGLVGDVYVMTSRGRLDALAIVGAWIQG